MKKSKTKIVALLAVFLLTVPLFACGKDTKDGKKDNTKNTTNKSQVNREIRLPYSHEDGLNPYAAKSLINQSIMPLLYDSLYVVDGNYKPNPSVAKSATVLATEVTVEINPSKRFANGSYICAQDVVHSFELAKQSAYYSQPIINIKKAQATGSSTVVFFLEKVDAFALSCLDFPIVKADTLTDGTMQYPESSGRYSFDNSEAAKYLKVNSSFKDNESKDKKIELVNITDSKAIIHSLVIGNIDSLFCDLGEGSYERINAGTQDVAMNNLVFLGINKYSPALSSPDMRQAINTILDREKITSEGFQGHATPAFTPFNPKWYELKSVKQTGKDAEKEKAQEYIAENAKKLKIRLVVNSDNEFKVVTAQKIAQNFRTYGIEVEVVELEFGAYNSAVASGKYDMYLGEIKLTNNMNLYPVLKADDLSYAYYNQLLDGTMTMQEFLDGFYSELPFIPVCYRSGILAFSRNIAVEVKSHENDLYQNINEWHFKK